MFILCCVSLVAHQKLCNSRGRELDLKLEKQSSILNQSKWFCCGFVNIIRPRKRRKMVGEGRLFSSLVPREWVRGKVIASGSFGAVHLAVNKSNGSLFVVKSAESHQGNMSIENEANVLENLKSPHIVQCLGKHVSHGANGEKRTNLFIEYMAAGSLADVAEKLGGKLDEGIIRLYTREILKGLKYLHNHGIVHCDVKCKNVLLDSCGNVKLADFGCARRLVNNDNNQKYICGTPLWMAPEVLRNEGLDFSADIWSLGCTVIEMATGKSPWVDLGFSNPMATILKIASGKERPSLPSNFSEEGLDFLDKCLQTEPGKRPTVEELLNHPFITGETMEKNSQDGIACSPLSVLDIGAGNEDYESEESPNQRKMTSRMPFSTRVYERQLSQRHCTGNELVSQENWVTVRS